MELFQWRALSGVLEVQDAAEFVEGAVQNELRRFRAEFQKLLKSGHRRPAEGFDNLLWRNQRIGTVFTQTLRRSLFLSAFAQIEDGLNWYCSTLEARNPRSVRLKELKGTGLRRARVYLKKVAQLPFPDQSSEWRQLLLLADVRNAFAHRDGLIGEIIQQQRKRIGELPGIEVGEYRFTLESDAVSHLTGIGRSFLESVVRNGS